MKLLVGLLAAGAAAAIAATSGRIVDTIADDPVRALVIAVATLLLQFLSIDLGRGRGGIGFASVGLVAAAVLLGAGPAMAVGVVAAAIQLARSRGKVLRALFDAGNLALSAGAAAGTYAAVADSHPSTLAMLLAVTLAGAVFVAINNGVLCLVMSLSQSRPLGEVWRERFDWARLYFLASGPAAAAVAIAYEQAGLLAAAALLSLPLLLVLVMRESARSRAAIVR